MMTLDDVLHRWIPYRLQALDTLQFAWRWIGESDNPRRVEVFEEGKLKLRGNVAAIANPMIEVGIIHARSLLEFLGLCVLNGRLGQVRNRRSDDIALEHYSTKEIPLAMVTPHDALSTYKGPIEEAESSLVAIFEYANKGVAHFTSGDFGGKYTEQHLEIASRGIPALLQNHLYAKLGMNIPPPPTSVPQIG